MKETHLRLIVGLLILPALLLQRSLIAISIQTLYTIILVVREGKKFRLLPNIVVLLSVSAAHLLQPNGLHLGSVWGFPITLGSLELGGRKALTLIALLYLSQYMIKGRPHFPGRLGSLIASQFYYFSKITTAWKSLEVKRPFIDAIDHLFIKLEEGETENSLDQEIQKASLRHIIFSVFNLLFFWALFIVGLYVR